MSEFHLDTSPTLHLRRDDSDFRTSLSVFPAPLPLLYPQLLLSHQHLKTGTITDLLFNRPHLHSTCPGTHPASFSYLPALPLNFPSTSPQPDQALSSREFIAFSCSSISCLSVFHCLTTGFPCTMGHMPVSSQASYIDLRCSMG
jgi:hypothetical protein